MFSGHSDTEFNWYRMPHYHAKKFSFPYKQGGTIQTAYWKWVRLIPKRCLGMVQETDTCLRPNPFEGPFWQFKNKDNHKNIEILFEDDLIQLPAWSWTITISSSGLPRLCPATSWKDRRLEIWQPLWATSLCFWWSNFSYSPIWTSEPQSMAVTPCCTIWNYREEYWHKISLTDWFIVRADQKLRAWAPEDGWGRVGAMAEINCTNWRGRCLEKELKIPHLWKPPSENIT